MSDLYTKYHANDVCTISAVQYTVCCIVCIRCIVMIIVIHIGNRHGGAFTLFDRFVYRFIVACDSIFYHWRTVLLRRMYKKNQGHGICGAKNIYSSDVKLGNWVEDTIGLDLVQKGRTIEKNYNTNTALSFKDPKEQPPLPEMPINMPTTQELKAKNKEGMSYSLIFDHGLKTITPEVCDGLSLTYLS